jgi:hypothetical protein
MMIDPVRPEADVYFHNLTGFDGNVEYLIMRKKIYSLTNCRSIYIEIAA